MRLKLTASPGQANQMAGRFEKIMATAATNAVRAAAKAAVAAGRAEIASSGLGSIWQRSLVASPFRPKTGVSLNPSAWVHSKINYSDVFESGRDISGKPFIWLPLPTVPRMTGAGLKFGGIVSRPHMTPRQYARSVGKLYTIRRPGKPPMLGAKINKSRKPQPFGRFASKRVLSKRGNALGPLTEIIPLFVAVPAVHLPKKFSVEAAIKSAVERNIDDFYQTALVKATDGD